MTSSNGNAFTDFCMKLRDHFCEAGRKIRRSCRIIDLSDKEFQDIITESIEDEMKTYDPHAVANPMGAARKTFMGRHLN